MRLGLLKIPISEFERAVAFYETGLGLAKVFAAEEYGWAQFDADGLPIALYVTGKGGGNRSPGGSVDFHLVHADLDALRTRLIQSYPDCGAEVFENNDGSRSLEFSDPDGNELKVMAG